MRLLGTNIHLRDGWIYLPFRWARYFGCGGWICLDVRWTWKKWKDEHQRRLRVRRRV